jgi:hypothetical protein
MEDGIDNNRTTLYDRIELEKKFLYVFIPKNNEYKDFIFLYDRNKALEIIKKYPNSTVEVFLQNYNRIYKYIYKI